MVHNIDQQQMSSELVRELIKERRSERRWRNIRFFVWVIVIIVFIMFLFTESEMVSLGKSDSKGYVSYIRLEGMIETGRPFSAQNVLPALKKAFSDTQAKGVIIDIDSGGGTPVQASIIHDAILNMKNKYHKKVVVVGEDMLTSGAYYVAVAGDKIYVNPNTVTGSIGVIMKGFGFPELIKKIGVERRVYTAGSEKDRLDPFLPQNAADIEKIKTVIDEIHRHFIDIVLQGRQGKLKKDPKELFTGDFWSGSTAVELGLVDNLGNLIDALQNEFHVNRYRDYTSSQNSLNSLMSQFGMAMDMSMNKDSMEVLEKL